MDLHGKQRPSTWAGSICDGKLLPFSSVQCRMACVRTSFATEGDQSLSHQWDVIGGNQNSDLTHMAEAVKDD